MVLVFGPLFIPLPLPPLDAVAICSARNGFLSGLLLLLWIVIALWSVYLWIIAHSRAVGEVRRSETVLVCVSSSSLLPSDRIIPRIVVSQKFADPRLLPAL